MLCKHCQANMCPGEARYPASFLDFLFGDGMYIFVCLASGTVIALRNPYLGIGYAIGAMLLIGVSMVLSGRPRKTILIWVCPKCGDIIEREE